MFEETRGTNKTEEEREMDCYYYIGNVDFAPEQKGQVEALLTKHDLEGLFTIEDYDHGAYLQQQQGDMSHSTAGDIDEMLDEMAVMVAGTPHDGQVIDSEYESEKAGHVLVGGKRHDVACNQLITKTDEQLPIGQETETLVFVKVLGLPNKQAIIIGLSRQGV